MGLCMLHPDIPWFYACYMLARWWFSHVSRWRVFNYASFVRKWSYI